MVNKRLLAVTLLLWAGSAGASSESYLHYVKALAAERAGNLHEALDEYQKVVELDPAALEAYRDLAELQLRAGHTDAALESAEKVRDLAPKEASSYIFLGHIHMMRGDVAKGAADFEEALKYDPENLKALETLAAYYSTTNIPKAIEYYGRCLEAEPEDPEIYFRLGWLHQKEGHLVQAEESYKKSIELEPQQAATHLALAGLYESEKKIPEAVAEYEAAVPLDNRNISIFTRLGHLQYGLKRFDAAEQTFLKAKELDSKEPTNYYWLARIAEERKKWGDAGQYAEQAYHLSRDPQFLPLLAYYLTLQGRVPQAVKWLEKAREIDSKNANVLLFLGMGYIDQRKYGKAREVLETGAGNFPSDPQMHFQLGLAYDHLGRFDEAMEQFHIVLHLDPKNTAAMNYLGYSYADKGEKLEEAEQLIRQALQLEPQNGAFLDSLGWVRFKQGFRDDAQKNLERAVTLLPDAEIFDHLGDVYWAGQQTVKALDAWNKALSLDPGLKDVRKKIKKAKTQGAR